MDISYLLSKVLGSAVVAASLLTKVPQILAIVRNRSGFGVSLPSMALEVFLYAITFSFHFVQAFPLTTYLEYAFLMAQDAAIIALILHYGPGFTPRAAAGAAVWAAFLAFLASGLCPLPVLALLQSSTTVFFIVAKLPQILENHRTRCTGSLSLVTTAALGAGNALRLFTTVVEMGANWPLIVGYATGLLINGIIAAQILVYGPTPAPAAAETPAETPAEAKKEL